MTQIRWSAAVIALSLVAGHSCLAAEASEARSLSPALAVVQRAASNYPKHRDCFSCHHQTLPMLAMVTARQQQLPVDMDLLQAQGKFTHESFEKQIKEMTQGGGVGGRAMTVGYALWALDLAGCKPDKTTEAMVTYLLKTQKKDGHWEGQVPRPPLEESFFTCTVLACSGIRKYATDSHKADATGALTRAKTWLTHASPKNHEDRVSRLRGLDLLQAAPDEIAGARQAVLTAQRSDGGWAQADGMESDAYATGQTLFVLRQTGLAATSQAYQRGVEFLVKTQFPDGSWLVKTRSKPVQTYFDNGDPHGKNQFISIAATSWALAAVAMSTKRE